MSLLRHPRLPEGEATHVLASGEFPWLAEALERRGLTVVATQRDSRLPGPVQFRLSYMTDNVRDEISDFVQHSSSSARRAIMGAAIEKGVLPC